MSSLNNSSFRDPNGFVFSHENKIFRAVYPNYFETYSSLDKSGFLNNLTDKSFIVKHNETTPPQSGLEGLKILEMEFIPFISYPFEWSFSQLKDAAILTLDIQIESLKHGFSLKDASSYNIQFLNGKPIFIDILSFEKYKEGSPWIAYRQFCEHFLCPLALLSYNDISLNSLLLKFLDGIPLEVTKSLLPLKARFSSLLIHVFFHAASQAKHTKSNVNTYISKNGNKVTKNGLLGLLHNLKSCVEKLSIKKQSTEWSNYYENTNYSLSAETNKKNYIKNIFKEIYPPMVIDIGANTGRYSRIASDMGIYTISADIDQNAVESNYLEVKRNKEQKILPLIIDITNPSPSIGWNNKERESFLGRVKPGSTILALALIHHLRISQNIPFKNIAFCLSSYCNNLIIEFIPKSDSKVQQILCNKEDFYQDYCIEEFESEFSVYFKMENKKHLQDSERTLYHFTKRT